MQRKNVVKVRNRTETSGSAGQKEPGMLGPEIPFRCNVRPLSQSEIQYWGDKGTELRRIFGNGWPGDMNSQIEFEGWYWDQVDPGEFHRYGILTKHDEILIRRRSKVDG